MSATRARGWRGGWRHSICTEGPRNPVGSGPGHARGSRGAKHPVPYAQVCPVGPLACLGILGEIFRKKSKHVHWHAFCFTVLTSACPVPPSTSIIISNTTLKLGNGEKSLLVKGYFFLLIEKKKKQLYQRSSKEVLLPHTVIQSGLHLKSIHIQKRKEHAKVQTGD